MKRLAHEFNITFRLLFTEAGHGKSPCDGVGENIKTQVEAAMLTKFGEHDTEPIHSAEDVKKVIEEKTNLTYEITVHTKEDIEQLKETMPKLGPLVGAMKLHEIMITPEGGVKKKNLPTDPFYQPVIIKETRVRAPRRIQAQEIDLNNAFRVEEGDVNEFELESESEED